jgi:hypothetical protein
MSTPRTAAVAALVAAIGLTAFAPAAFSAPPTGRPTERGSMPGGNMQPNQMDFRRDAGSGRFELVELRCGTGAADRMDRRLDRISDRLELTAEQEALYEAFRTSALAAQTAFADTCATLRPANAEQPAAQPVDPIAAMETRLKIDEARIASLAAVLPDLRAFYDSLTDEQKAGFMPRHMAQGHNGEGFGKPGFGQRDHRGPGREGRPGPQDAPPAPPAAPDAPTAPVEPAEQDG